MIIHSKEPKSLEGLAIYEGHCRNDFCQLLTNGWSIRGICKARHRAVFEFYQNWVVSRNQAQYEGTDDQSIAVSPRNDFTEFAGVGMIVEYTRPKSPIVRSVSSRVLEPADEKTSGDGVRFEALQ